MKTNATIRQLEIALIQVNKVYKNNIIFKDIEQVSSKIVNFTLRVKDSKGSGARRSYSGRRLVSACWHVHGNLFDCLIDMDESIYIQSLGKRIDKDGGNWVDWNIGSKFCPVYISYCCDC